MSIPVNFTKETFPKHVYILYSDKCLQLDNCTSKFSIAECNNTINLDQMKEGTCESVGYCYMRRIDDINQSYTKGECKK